ncbi:hypothetical protein Daes_0834 [Pseudodesulfovibrio aespoeensis Aspo-2]|uniref:Uncharacterized protein n=2 Tax=Desulfovibrionaceae TaxID=194924 RepID=E6VRC2_PSEA9|nr:hypothetical protein Daes_0834 [Pseudodesulfovibrio aespoeensis Aspo-2]
MVMLKPQDIIILLKLAIQPVPYEWSYSQLAYELHMSSSEIHKGVRRAAHARLFDPNRRRPIRKALEEFLIHGVKYAYAAEIGPMTRGMPTAHSAPVLMKHLAVSDGDVYVWPHPEGVSRGMALSPLFKTVPYMAARDDRLYQALAALDAIRLGRARDVALAESILLQLVRGDGPQ